MPLWIVILTWIIFALVYFGFQLRIRDYQEEIASLRRMVNAIDNEDYWVEDE